MTQMTLMKNSREQQDCKSLLCLYITRLCYQVHRKARSGPGCVKEAILFSVIALKYDASNALINAEGRA